MPNPIPKSSAWPATPPETSWEELRGELELINAMRDTVLGKVFHSSNGWKWVNLVAEDQAGTESTFALAAQALIDSMAN